MEHSGGGDGVSLPQTSERSLKSQSSLGDSVRPREFFSPSCQSTISLPSPQRIIPEGATEMPTPLEQRTQTEVPSLLPNSTRLNKFRPPALSSTASLSFLRQIIPEGRQSVPPTLKQQNAARSHSKSCETSRDHCVLSHYPVHQVSCVPPTDNSGVGDRASPLEQRNPAFKLARPPRSQSVSLRAHKSTTDPSSPTNHSGDDGEPFPQRTTH